MILETFCGSYSPFLTVIRQEHHRDAVGAALLVKAAHEVVDQAVEVPVLLVSVELPVAHHVDGVELEDLQPRRTRAGCREDRVTVSQALRESIRRPSWAEGPEQRLAITEFGEDVVGVGAAAELEASQLELAAAARRQ